uniref:Uncharacterized protein n=1 Tax=Oryza brachyantha TaxID=4533 RepID=J3LWR0_ORYBR
MVPYSKFVILGCPPANYPFFRCLVANFAYFVLFCFFAATCVYFRWTRGTHRRAGMRK